MKLRLAIVSFVVPFFFYCSRVYSYCACQGKSSLHIFAVTDVLPRIILFTLTGFTTQSLYCPQTVNIITVNIIAAIITHSVYVFFIVPQLVVSWRL